MKRGLSLEPHKKAAVTSKSIILNFFSDDLRVAALEIKLLTIDSPGFPTISECHGRVALLTHSRVTKRTFGLEHSTVPLFVMTHSADNITDSGLSSRLAPVHHFIHASLCECLQLRLLCFRNLVFRHLWWYLFAYQSVHLTYHSLCSPVK